MFFRLTSDFVLFRPSGLGRQRSNTNNQSLEKVPLTTTFTLRSSLLIYTMFRIRLPMHQLQRSGFNPGIRRQSGIWGAADEALLNGYLSRRLQPGYNYVGQTNARQPLHINWCGQVAWIPPQLTGGRGGTTSPLVFHGSLLLIGSLETSTIKVKKMTQEKEAYTSKCRNIHRVIILIVNSACV